MPEGSELLMPNWSWMIKGVTDAHLGPIWYHSEPSDVPHSPNQFLVHGLFFAVSYSNTALGYCFKHSLVDINCHICLVFVSWKLVCCVGFETLKTIAGSKVELNQEFHDFNTWQH